MHLSYQVTHIRNRNNEKCIRKELRMETTGNDIFQELYWVLSSLKKQQLKLKDTEEYEPLLCENLGGKHCN